MCYMQPFQTSAATRAFVYTNHFRGSMEYSCDNYYFEWKKNYLVLVESYSGWIELIYLASTTAHAGINNFKSHFARFGVPDLLYNEYHGRKFRHFASVWKLNLKTSRSRGYPQGNGLAERACMIKVIHIC